MVKERLLSILLSCCMMLTLLPAETLADAGKAAAQEQSEPTVGETYYFDLSWIKRKESSFYVEYPIAAERLPGGTLNYVPFTFMGKIDAYVLNSSAYRQRGASAEAEKTRDRWAKYGYTYEHDLFLANCAVLLPDKGGLQFHNQERMTTWMSLLYGMFHSSSDIFYSVRAPSIGWTSHNEWEQILAKDARLLAGSTADERYNYVGQECNNTFSTVNPNTRTWVNSKGEWKLNHYWSDDRTDCWRPVLEPYANAGPLRVVTLDLNGGSLGDDVKGELRLVTRKESGLKLPKKGGLKSPFGTAADYLRWVDADTGEEYRPGDTVPAGVSRLRADWASEEFFTLETGRTYYFDLSTEFLTNVARWLDPKVPGKVNGSLPDTTLHYVPFTYAGITGAYNNASELTAASATDEWAERNLTKHSLFVADHNITYNVSWDELNARNLIFGRIYAVSDGIWFYMRAPTGGSRPQGQAPYACEEPLTNEWDALINKDPGNIKNWKKMFSFAQEYQYYAKEDGTPVFCFRTIRGFNPQRMLSSCVPERARERTGYRPVLEPWSMVGFKEDMMQAVTLDLNGGTLGGSGKDIAIVAAKDYTFCAPASTGLTRPAGDESGTYFFWADDNGQRYRPGEKVPANTKRLTAQWDAHTHVWAEEWSSDGGHHWHECTADGCGITDDALKNGYAAHSGTDDGDCTTAVMCVCGHEIKKAEREHDWWRSGTHIRKCWRGGCEVTKIVPCSGGTATCREKATCSDCGKPYGELADHSFTAKNADARYLKIAAACTAKAVYYTSCSVCGLSSRDTAGEAAFESGEVDANSHTGSPGGWQYDATGHWREYSCCGAKAEAAAHRYEDNADTGCSDCPYERTIASLTYTVSFDANGGSGEMDAVTGVSGSYTLPECGFTAPESKQFAGWAATADGAVISGGTIEVTGDTTLYSIWEDASHRHVFDRETVKQEALKAAAGCTHDAVYYKSCACGAVSDKETFTAAGTRIEHDWAADRSRDAEGHWRECTRCHRSEVKTPHDFGEDDICDTCGYGRSGPHIHDLTPVPARAATCTEDGNRAYYTCDGCGGWFEDTDGTIPITDRSGVIIQAAGHTPSGWRSDGDGHWKECTVSGCGSRVQTEKHAFQWVVDRAATASEKGSRHEECASCGYRKAAVDIPATGSAARPTTPAGPAGSAVATAPKTGDDSAIGLWSAALCGSLAAGLALAAQRRRRRE